MNKLITLLFLIILNQNCKAQEPIYNHILITNDDGIEDKDRLISLAKGVKKVANKVSIVVSETDRSGTSNYITLGKYKEQLEVTTIAIDTLDTISIYTVKGTPSDCVALGLNGFFENNRPDLVLSGINGGPNSGPEWFGSGTIGAVRTAAALGVKGIALSGFDSNNQDSHIRIPKWIAQLISSKIMNTLQKEDYLTVGLPKEIEKIKGVKISERRISIEKPEFIKFSRIETETKGKTTIWEPDYTGDPIDRTKIYDDMLTLDGYIVITPMTINENNSKLIKKIETAGIPEFKKE